MTKKIMRMKSIGIAVGAFLCCTHVLNAANGIWTNGVVNKFWTNNLNWSASPYPSGTETATFTNSIAGKIQEVDLDGFAGVTNVIFDSSTIAHYRLGTNAMLQTFILRSSTVGSLIVTGTAGSNQTFNSIFKLGADAVAGTYTITNGNSGRTLTFLGAITNGVGGTAGTKTLNINGTGPVVAAGGITRTGTLNVNINSTAAATINGPNDVSALTRASSGSLTITGPSTIGTLTQSSSGTMNIHGTNTFTTLAQGSTGAMTLLNGTNAVTTLNQTGTGAVSVNTPANIDTVTQGATATINLTNAIVKVLNLNGAFGTVNIASGATVTFNSGGGNNLVATQDATINGPGVIVLSANGGDYANNSVANDKVVTINAKLTGTAGFEYYTGAATTGTFVFTAENDYWADTVFNQAGTIRFSTIRNKGVACNLGVGSFLRFRDNPGGRLQYVGSGDSTDRDVVLKNSGIIDQSGSGPLKFTGPVYQDVNAVNAILTLQGATTGSGEISGPISNNHATATLGITKAGKGNWTLTAENGYKGATIVSGGTLYIAGAAGSITNSSSITLSTGGTLCLLNRLTAKHANRLNDATPINMAGGTLDFFNNGGDSNYSESVGPMTVTVGYSRLSTSRAAIGKTSTLTLSSLTRTMGAIDFTGEGLGLDDRNRVFINGQADGLIGSWATVNGTTYAAYSSTRGVYAADGTITSSTDIAAQGPDSIIPEGASLKVRIATDGVSGPIELTNTITTISSLLQTTQTNAVVDTVGKTLRASTLVAQDGTAPLTIGQNANEGAVAPNQANSFLTLNSAGSGALTVNAVVANNGATSDLIKIGTGVATLTGDNTFTGDTSTYEGSLVLANSNALQYSRLTRDGVVFDSSVVNHRFTLGNLTNGYTSGWYLLNLTDNAGTPITLAVGNNNLDSVYTGNLVGNGVFEKIGTGSFRITGTVDHYGGTKVSEGKLIAASQDSLGFGPVINNSILDLTAANVTYRGLSTSLSGNGIVNVPNLGTGTQTVNLNGNYSGFTGVWNVGMSAVAGAGKIQMNGLDNPAATLNIFTNASIYCNGGSPHTATLNLHGGDTGESYGQLRLDNNTTWAGQINLKAPTTNVTDGLIGGYTTGTATSYIPGNIDDAGAGVTLDKVGASVVMVLSGANTYSGDTWVKQGTIQVPWCGTVASLTSPLGKGGKVMLGMLANGARLTCSGTNDITDRAFEMAGTTGAAFLRPIGAGTWTLTGTVTSPLAGNKRLNLEGTLGTTGVLAGVMSDSLTSTNDIFKTENGAWILSGDNTFKGNVLVDNGQLIVKHNRALGIGPKTAQAANNANAANPYFIFDGSAGDLTIPADITFRTSDQNQGAIINIAGNNTVQGMLHLTSGDGDTILTSLGGSLTFAGDVFPPTDTSRRLRFWGNANGEISGVISNGATTTGLPLWKESGTGNWLLSGNNKYTGSTTVSAGQIAVGGANGRIALGAGIIINGGTFAITNSSTAYLGEDFLSDEGRVANGNTVAMTGGAFRYDHPTDEQTYIENVSALTISSGVNTIAASQADAGYSSTLTFASLTRTAGTVDFVGAGLGDTRNKITFTTKPVAADGDLIGSWATVNGTNFAAYSDARGVYAADPIPAVGINAKGDMITNSATATVEIVAEGSGGADTLQGATENSVFVLKQNSGYASIVSMPSKTLKVSDVIVAAGKEALTIGESANQGLLMTLNAGTPLDLVNDATALLTINAAVTNNGTLAAGLTKMGTGPVNIAGRASYTGPTALLAGTLEYSGSHTQILSGVISGAGTLTKSGAGQLTLSGANTYTGDLTISGGTVISGNNTALGTVDGETIITGGTLNFSAARDHGAERVKVQGAGVNGLGAIVNTAADSMNAFRFITLTADTTFGGTYRWDIRAAGTPLTATFNMGGFTLTKTNSNTIALQNVQFQNPGHVVVNQGLFRVEYDTPLGGTEANTFTVKAGASLDTWNHYWPILWSLTGEENATFVAGSSQSVTQNVWNSGVNLSGKVYFKADGLQTFNGPITNSGSVVKTGASTTYFNNQGNTYAGTTVVSNGTLYAKYAGSLPGYDNFKVTVVPNALLHLPIATNGSDFGWTTAQLGAISPSTFALSNAWLLVETFADFDHTSSFPQSPNSFGLRKLGVGAMKIPENQTILASLYMQGGSLLLSNIVWQTAQITTEIAWNAGETATLTLAGNTVLTSFLGAKDVAGTALVAGRNGRGVVVLKDSAIVTNKLHVGGNANSAGAIYQSGSSTMFNWGGGNNDGRVGMTGYGYYEFNSGTFTNIGYFQLGRDAAGIGILVQKGGAFSQGNAYGGNLALSRGGTGVIYTDGGTFRAMGQDANYALEIGDDSDNNASGGLAIFTADDNADVEILGNVCLANRNNMTAVLNLNGGLFRFNTIQCLNNRYNSPSHLNLNGVTMRSRQNGTLISGGVNAPTAVNVLPDGAIIDTLSFTNTISASMVAPAGKGVSAIGITLGSGYIGPPMVTITGGGGSGATALALFDSSNGTVTGIKVTSPGINYINVPTVTFSGGGCTNVAVALTGVLLADNVSGGLTKNGSGVLTLAAANTYTGPTVINEGTLRLGIAGAIHMDSDIILNGGVLDLGGNTLVTRATVTVNAGVIVNGIIVSESLDKVTVSSATFGVTMDSLQPINIAAGTYKLGSNAGVSPGLLYGKISNNFNITDLNPCTAVTNALGMANTQSGWGANETHVYSGYIWNRAATNVTWTFAEHIDNNAMLKIDGVAVLYNTSYTAPSLASYVLTPGPHTFEVRVGNDTGGAGPSGTVGTWFTPNNSFGIGVDYQGRGATNIANFVAITDPGDGSLFTTALPAFSENTALELAAGATLDLNGTTQTIANLSGSGTVTNGTLVISGLLTPAGDAIGDLTFNCNLTVTGRIVLDVSASDNDSLIVSGNLDVSAADLEVVNAATMPKQNYTFATAGGTITGIEVGDFVTWVNNPDAGNWKVKRDGSAIKLIYLGGTIILLY